MPSPGLATAFIGAVTVDHAASETAPVATRSDAPPTDTVAVDSACRPMNFELGDGGATVERALSAMAAPTRLASVTVVDAEPVAFTSPLKAEPVWSFAAWRLIEPVPVFTTAPEATTIVSARTRKATPGSKSVPLIVTVSSPSPPSTVNDDVGIGNEMLSIVGADATRLPTTAVSLRIVMWSLPALPLICTEASGELVGAVDGTIVIGSSPA